MRSSMGSARLALLVALTTCLSILNMAPPAVAAPPATPKNLPISIEAFQPYIGQSTCDPVAKPGVKAFMNLVLATYPDTGSDGIVRDCGIGGQSEHKEGRAWDWQVSASNPTDVKHVNELMSWLMATDSQGNADAMVRRLGIMYMIWNKHIWKAYQASKGWQAYSGTSEHTDHVHFSFGWAGAREHTSFWTGKVAPIDDGPGSAPAFVAPTVTPVAAASNLPVLASYGSSTVNAGATGPAVTALQTALQLTADGTWGSSTTTAVEQFQQQQGLPVGASWSPADWLRLLPKPTVPFGALEHVDPDRGGSMVTGWAIDAGDDVPLDIHVYVDGVFAQSVTEDQPRPDITAQYTAYPATHGFRMPLQLSDGSHQVCAYAINAPGTTGATGKLGCLTTVVQHGPVGALESVLQTPTGITATGWALDADTDAPIGIDTYVDGTFLQRLDAAEVSRQDLAERFPDYSSGHGYAIPLSLPDGAHRVCTYGLNAPNTAGSNALLGCVTLTVAHNGVGSLDPLATPPGSVTVSGIALDPDTTSTVSADIYVDGTFTSRLAASGSRPALAGYTAWGDDHGFSATLALTQGSHKVCAYALNAPGTPGTNHLLGCDAIAVAHAPTGALESVVQTPAGIVATGWALDPDTTASTSALVAVDGGSAVTATASLTRTDIAALYPALGAAHGFRTVLTGLAAGSHKVCVTATNASGTPGSDVALPCLSVSVAHSPVGIAPVLSRRGNDVIASGWAVDPDTASSIRADVWVDGKAVTHQVASLSRSDLPQPWTGYGTAHGYSFDLSLAAGSHSVCVYGINSGVGSNAKLGCTTVVVAHNAFGAVTQLFKRSDGVVISGWAIDPDTTAGLSVSITVDGKAVRTVGAVLPRSDVGASYPSAGPKHGFATVLSLAKGSHTVCANALNASGTSGVARVSLGCRSIPA